MRLLVCGIVLMLSQSALPQIAKAVRCQGSVSVFCKSRQKWKVINQPGRSGEINLEKCSEFAVGYSQKKFAAKFSPWFNEKPVVLSSENLKVFSENNEEEVRFTITPGLRNTSDIVVCIQKPGRARE